MRGDDFHDIETLRQRLDELRRRAEEVPSRLEEVLSEAFEELMSPLEELQVAEAELKTSNEQLRTEIAERVQTEKGLRESEERLRTLLESKEVKYRTLFEESKDVVFISTPDGKFIDINPTGVELFGYSSKEELLQIDIAKDLYFDPCDRENYQNTIGRNKHVKDYELIFKRKDGRQLNVIVTANAKSDDKGKVVAYQGIIRDITEQKKLRGRLARSEKLSAIGEVAAAVAHEIRSPLGAIYNSIDTLSEHLKLSENQRKLMDIVIEAMERLNKIVDDFLAFAHPWELFLKEASIKDILDDTLLLLRQDDRFKSDITLDVHYEKDVPTAKIDINLMPEVLLNILINSVPATTKGGKIRIDVGRSHIDGKKALGIKISDTWEGIPPDTLKVIFEPFYTDREDGTELGLVIANRIINDHGGTIDVESQVGDGTTFTVKLPLSAK